MIFDEEINILKKIISFFGVERQIIKLMEECGELITEISRAKLEKSTVRKLVGEMVDVQIVLQQMQLSYPKELWQEIRSQKINRLKELIDG